jgi:dTDP-glucose pyrophosphorylase
MDIQEILVSADTSIKKCINLLDQTAKKIVIIVEGRKLKGVITDGDIRRWILKNGSLDENVDSIMNCSPIYLRQADAYRAEQVMKEKFIEAIPILNEQNEIVDIIFWHDTFNKKLNHYSVLDNPVVIMAGGKGTRLYPYTRILPKPLIPIGEVSIVERIINNFLEFGCSNFFLTVNYKKNMIKAYFEELDNAYDITYIEEEKFLGTGGSLYFLKDRIKDTFFVSNCDILVDANYSDILKYHKENKNKITMVTSLKNYAIPYGVINLNSEGLIKTITEKPEYNYQVNTGLYILEPETLERIPENTFFHITDLINKYIEQGERVGVYPITENAWLDMGEIKEMQRMIEKLDI